MHSHPLHISAKLIICSHSTNYFLWLKQRGGLRVVEIFARHGPPAAAHSAAAAAKEQTETGRRQVVRYGHEQADTARVTGKRPAGGRQPARPAPSARQAAGPAGGGGGSGANPLHD